MPINRYFHSDMIGAPQLRGNTPGGLTALLEACLVTGFGATSASAVTVLDGVATATVTNAPFEAGAVIAISGATPAALNGEARVRTASGNSVTWATTAPNGTASGTISLRYAPQGWAKPFSGTNVAVFKPTAPESSGCLLRVDASSGLAARVRGYESMTDANTGTGLFPTDAQFSGGGYWPCSFTNNATAVPWEVYSSDTGVHLVTSAYFAASSTRLGRTGWWFGDLRSRKSGDAYACALVAGANATDGAGTNYRSVNGSGFSVYMARSHTQIGGSRRGGRYSPLLAPRTTSGVDSEYSGQIANGGTYPNGPDNALILSPLLVLEGETSSISSLRGRIPGIYHSSQLIEPGTFMPRDVVEGSGEFAGRRLHASPGQSVSQSLSTQAGAVFYDLSDVWD